MKAQRYKVGYYTDEWGMSSSTPCLLPDTNGYAVKYLDYAEIEKQRDELLAALESCRFALEPYDDVKPRDWKTDRERLARAHQTTVAAIASVKESK